MTGLTALGFETADIMVRKARGEKPAQYITVRGLSAQDVMRLVKIHGPALGRMFEMVVQGKVKLDLDNAATIAGMLMDQAPAMLGDLIVMAADTPPEEILAAHEQAIKLPVSVQLECIERIAELTFVDTTPGEFLGIVVKMLGGMNGLLTAVGLAPADAAQPASSPSPGGSKGSERTSRS